MHLPSKSLTNEKEIEEVSDISEPNDKIFDLFICCTSVFKDRACLNMLPPLKVILHNSFVVTLPSSFAGENFAQG